MLFFRLSAAVRAGLLALPLIGSAAAARAQMPAVNPAQWTAELRAFARQDSLTPPPARPILFYGSSSVRKWETLRQDFPGRPVLNRGFGGSRFPEALYFFGQLVVAYQPRQVVLYEGDNDIGSGASAQEVFQSFLAFEKLMQQKLPKVPLVFLAIKPSPARWALYPTMQEANRLIRAYISAHPKRLRFVDTAAPLLGPRPALPAVLHRRQSAHDARRLCYLEAGGATGAEEVARTLRLASPRRSHDCNGVGRELQSSRYGCPGARHYILDPRIFRQLRQSLQ